MEKTSADEQQANIQPRPVDFLNYLPWACNQLQVDATLLINKVFQNEYVSVSTSDRIKKVRSKAKLTVSQSRHDVGSDQEKEKSTSDLPQFSSNTHKIVKILAVYDNVNNLVELKFLKNSQIPRAIIKIIGLILQFQPNLVKIEINGGLDKYTIYEINSFLNKSNITELCFDGSFLKEANYDILLNANNTLRYLSLSRCKIDDSIIENIAEKLVFPHPASKSLYVLNLSSNRITDVGAQHLAQALRSNRNLIYLSLSDNSITDDGAGYLLEILAEFPLKTKEIYESKVRHMMYLKDKNAMINNVIKELRSGEIDKKVMKRKSTRPISVTPRKGKLEKEPSLKSVGDAKSLVNMDILYYDKALNIVENRLGEFKDPFSGDDTNFKDGILYCKGNNKLCYLNLAYNNLSYLSLKKILAVLICQKLLDRRPRGLINLLIEGNNLPVSSKEMLAIDDILEMGLMAHNRRLSVGKKRPQSKTTSR